MDSHRGGFSGLTIAFDLGRGPLKASLPRHAQQKATVSKFVETLAGFCRHDHDIFGGEAHSHLVVALKLMLAFGV